MSELHLRSALALAMKVGAAGASFLLNLYLARVLGAGEMGVYYVVYSLIAVAFVIGKCGFDNPIVRLTAAYSSSGRGAEVSAVLRKALLVSLVTSLGLGGGLWIGRFSLEEQLLHTGGRELLFGYAALAIAPLALLTLIGQYFKGIQRVVESLFIMNVATPILCLFISFFLVPLYGVQGALLSYALGAVIVFVSSFLFLIRRVDFSVVKREGVESVRLFGAAFPSLLVAIFQLVCLWNTTLILSSNSSSEEVGVFGVANRVAMLMSFFLVAVNAAVSPKVAVLYAKDEMPQLHKLVLQATRLLFAVSIVLLIIYYAFSEQILSVFGEEYVKGEGVLRVICLGYFFDVATGCTAIILSMTGNERLLAKSYFLAALVGVAASLTLIPSFGAIGAASSISLTLLTQNVLALYFSKKVLGLNYLRVFGIDRRG